MHACILMRIWIHVIIHMHNTHTIHTYIHSMITRFVPRTRVPRSSLTTRLHVSHNDSHCANVYTYILYIASVGDSESVLLLVLNPIDHIIDEIVRWMCQVWFCALAVRGAKYAKIRGPTYWIHTIVCSMQGYSAEYVDLVTYFGIFCLISDVFRTSAGSDLHADQWRLTHTFTFT